MSNQPSAARLAALVTLGVAAVSCGSIFIRLAAAPALAVAAYRMVWATLLFAPLALGGPVRELKPLRSREWCLLGLSGLALAFHFALWIGSLGHTSVASSVLLVNTTPFFVGSANLFFFRRPCPRAFWIGLAVAFLGCVLIFRGDLAQGSGALYGNLLALGGAVAMAVYFLVGASLRGRLPLLSYVWPVYGAAALILLPAALFSGSPLRGFTPQTHLYMFLVGLVPQCIGHTTYNWSLRWLPAHVVALLSLSEPVGAALLAWIVLGEAPTPSRVAGGAVVLLGIYLATRKGG